MASATKKSNLSRSVMGFAITIWLTAGAWAQSEPFSLKTPAGLVEIKPGAGQVCGADTYEIQCSVLSIAGKRIFIDRYVSVPLVLPSKEYPLVLAAEVSSGGSCCPPDGYLIDVSGRKASVLKGYTLSDKARVVGLDVVFDMVDGQDKIGDAMSSIFRYRLGSGRKPAKIASEVRRAGKTPGGHLYAYDVVNDPVLRAPLVAVVGRDNFREFRAHFGVSGPTTLIDNQYLIGDGIIPHSGPNGGIFVIDTKNGLAWALVLDDAGLTPTTRRWGVLTWQDSVARKQIDAWLAEKNVQPWRVKDVPLSEKLVSLYLAPRSKGPPPPQVKAALASPSERSSKPIDAPLEKSGGTLTVPVTINDAIRLNFVVDSGAADVSIPADVVMTLTRTGTIQPADFLGEKTYRLADGSTVPSKTFRIRSLRVGDRVLEDVTGSVASVNGSLLLGQSFLNRFKSWSIDNEKHVLVLR